MSDNRKHTDVMELGWLDVLIACRADPYVRAEGHDELATQLKGRLVRFNRAVQVVGDDEVAGCPRVHAVNLVRTGENNDLLVPGTKTLTISWDEWDWVSWHPTLDPSGRRFKITHTGQSHFGDMDLWDDNRLVDRRTNEVLGRFDDRSAAVVAAVRRLSRVA